MLTLRHEEEAHGVRVSTSRGQCQEGAWSLRFLRPAPNYTASPSLLIFFLVFYHAFSSLFRILSFSSPYSKNWPNPKLNLGVKGRLKCKSLKWGVLAENWKNTWVIRVGKKKAVTRCCDFVLNSGSQRRPSSNSVGHHTKPKPGNEGKRFMRVEGLVGSSGKWEKVVRWRPGCTCYEVVKENLPIRKEN